MDGRLSFGDGLNGLRALAEPTRLRLAALLGQSALSVTDMVAILGQSQPRLSRHLKLLCDAGLLERAPEGAHVYFRLAGGGTGSVARAILANIDQNDPVLALDRQRLAAIRRDRAVTAEAYFQRHAAEWDQIRSLHIPEAEVERAIRKQMPRNKVGDLLDLGTGTGRMLQLYSQCAERAVGVDSSREMLAIARVNLDGPDYAHCMLRRARAESLPFADSTFDIVLSHMVLHFLSHPKDVIREAARVLRPRGRLILADFAPHDATVLGPEHGHRWAGFSDATIGGWMEEAGLIVGRAAALPGGALTVKLWRGERPSLATSQPVAPADANLELFP